MEILQVEYGHPEDIDKLIASGNDDRAQHHMKPVLMIATPHVPSVVIKKRMTLDREIEFLSPSLDEEDE